MSAVLIADQVQVPLGIRGLRDFRKWLRSPSFPESGRVDFIAGNIEIEMSPEQFFSHGGPKEALARTLGPLNFHQKLGFLRIDKIRVTCADADLSAEPDLVFVSRHRLERNEVEFSSAGQASFLEIQGGPDLVVEIVSDSSVAKDTRRLPQAYFAAGVREFWLVDARDDDELFFQIHRRGKVGFQRVRPAAGGFQKSAVFDQAFLLTRQRDRLGYWEFELQTK